MQQWKLFQFVFLLHYAQKGPSMSINGWALLLGGFLSNNVYSTIIIIQYMPWPSNGINLTYFQSVENSESTFMGKKKTWKRSMKQREYRQDCLYGSYTIFLLHLMRTLSTKLQLSSKILARSSLWFSRAISRGVCPLLFLSRLLAPLIRSSLTTSLRDSLVATMRGVYYQLLRAFMSAPTVNMYETICVYPLLQAQCKIVSPFMFTSLMLQLWADSIRYIKALILLCSMHMNSAFYCLVVRKCIFDPHYYRNCIIGILPCRAAYSIGMQPYLFGEFTHARSLSENDDYPLQSPVPWLSSVNYLQCLMNNFIRGRSFLNAAKWRSVLLFLSIRIARFNWLFCSRQLRTSSRDFMPVI